MINFSKFKTIKMKSFVFCTCYANAGIRYLHPERYSKWIKYNGQILDELGAGHIFLIDDGSERKDIGNIAGVDAFYRAEELPDECHGKVNMVSFDSHLGRKAVDDYQGWWRNFTYSIDLAEKYQFDKIIHIESDFFILSDRLKEYIKNLQQGWTALYSSTFACPESAVQVICKDNFPWLRKILDRARKNNYQFNRNAELILPFTHVNKNFTGDRIGEIEAFVRWAREIKNCSEFDFIGQISPEIKALSSEKLHGLLSAFNERSIAADEKDMDILFSLLREHDLMETVTTNNLVGSEA